MSDWNDPADKGDYLLMFAVTIAGTAILVLALL